MQNKITLDDTETYECLFKEYWEIIKVKEGLTSGDILAALPNYKKGKSIVHHKQISKGEEEKQNDSMSRVIDDDSKPAKRKRYNSEMKEGLTSDDIFAAQPNYKKGKDLLHHRKNCKGEEEKQNDSMSRHSGEDYKPARQN